MLLLIVYHTRISRRGCRLATAPSYLSMDHAPTKNPPDHSAQRVLIVRPSALGDVARSVPVLATLRHHLPDARIDWLVADASTDAVAHHPMLDRVVPFPRNDLRYAGLLPRPTRAALRFVGQLRRGRYELVYDLQGLFRSGLITRLTGAARRVGLARARELGWLGYNVRHVIPEHAHSVDQMLALLEADGLEPVRDMRLYTGVEDRRWADSFCQQRDIDPEDYLCIAPTARWRCKCWPIERYAQLARRLLEEQPVGRDIVLLSSPSERDQVHPLLDALTPEQRRRVHFPRTSVGQMMALLSRTRLLVCNDSAALHIAVGFDRPVVALYGPTDPEFVGPYNRPEAVIRPAQAAQLNNRLVYRHHRHDQTLIAGIDMEQVWSAVLERIAQPQAHRI